MNLFDIDSLARVPAVHLVGIGGISMSGLAEILLKKGFAVTGSDSKASALTRAASEPGRRNCNRARCKKHYKPMPCGIYRRGERG